jgi:uracil-DNA glycosylase
MKLAKNWHEILKDEIQKPYVGELKEFLRGEQQQGAVVYPPESQIFYAFGLTPYEDVKVVIMGQDPYHGPGQAHGMSFSVPEGTALPPSLKNIYKELETDCGIAPASTGCLVKWASQGVLLLNATLTVRQGEPKSHYGRGWERFTDAVIAKLAERKDPMVFVLWGRSAREKFESVLKDTHHAVLTSAHPSPFSAHYGFFGSRPFSKANAFLKQWGKTPIDWSVNQLAEVSLSEA